MIIFSFYHYNKGSNTNANSGYSDSARPAPRYKMEIDPQRTDLSWYEKLILRYVMGKKEKQQRSEAEQRDELQNLEQIEDDHDDDDIGETDSDTSESSSNATSKELDPEAQKDDVEPMKIDEK